MDSSINPDFLFLLLVLAQEEGWEYEALARRCLELDQGLDEEQIMPPESPVSWVATRICALQQDGLVQFTEGGYTLTPTGLEEILADKRVQFWMKLMSSERFRSLVAASVADEPAEEALPDEA